MKYVFLDIEWNRYVVDGICGNDIMEIGALGVRNDYTTEKKFFSYVQPQYPKQIDKSQYSLLHTKKTVFENAESITYVLKKFAKEFPKIPYLIVWGRESYAIFENELKKYNIDIPIDHVIVLQDVYGMMKKGSVRDKAPGFRTALKSCQIHYENQLLHDSRYDAFYLKQLFIILKHLYENQYRSFNKYFFRSGNSDVLHLRKCHYIRRMNKENIRKAHAKMLWEGYRICQYCCERFPKTDFSKECVRTAIEESGYKYVSEEVFVEWLCERMKFKYHLTDGVIFVETGISKWFIELDGHKVVDVYHENSGRTQKVSQQKFRNNYHNQELNKKKTRDILYYIKEHDAERLKYRNSKERRIYELLDSIKKTAEM